MARPLSIGIVTPTVSREGGGIFPVVLAHARELAAQGHAVTVHGLDCDPDGRDRGAWFGLDLHPHRAGPFGLAPRLLSSLLAADHDILHQHGLWLYPSVAVSAWRARTGRPTVVSTHGMLEPWALANAAWKKRLAGAAFEVANMRQMRVVHCAPAEVPGVAAYAPGTPIASLPNGTRLPDPAVIGPGPATGEGRRTLLYLGRFHPKKGLAQLLDAWARLKTAHPGTAATWRLVIAGKGSQQPELEALAVRLGLRDDEVSFRGPHYGADQSRLFATADAFVLPSHSEGFPMAVLEAWAHALPVLMTPACNMPDGFAAGAAIAIPNEPEALARTLADVLPNADFVEIGRAGRRLVEERYGWPAVVAQLAAVYAWLAEGRDRPPCLVS